MISLASISRSPRQVLTPSRPDQMIDQHARRASASGGNTPSGTISFASAITIVAAIGELKSRGQRIDGLRSRRCAPQPPRQPSAPVRPESLRPSTRTTCRPSAASVPIGRRQHAAIRHRPRECASQAYPAAPDRPTLPCEYEEILQHRRLISVDLTTGIIGRHTKQVCSSLK